ncbi:MAG: stage II sporulation protein M [Candidatus Acidiferrales bacterium]
MISTRWLEKRKPYWTHLETLVDRAGRRGVRTLSHSELQELGLLYRQTASDLATVREDATSKQLAAYLNQLLGRAHNLVYMGGKPKVSGLIGFYRDTYPAIFRSVWRQTALATIICFVTGIAAWLVTIHDPAFASRLLGPEMMQTIERREMWTKSIVTIKPLASSAIMTNNLIVAFTTFALGITAGIGTIWMLFVNGLLIGVIGAATWRAGMALQLWSFVAAHGVLELPAIFISGGAGLEIARGMLFPGLLPRRDSLAQAGGRASRLLLGTVPMLIVAGVIEGFVSPSDLPVWMKFSLAAVLFALLVTYLSWSPKTEPQKAQ